LQIVAVKALSCSVLNPVNLAKEAKKEEEIAEAKKEEEIAEAKKHTKLLDFVAKNWFQDVDKDKDKDTYN
jgi:hypothetical protein